MIDGSDGIHPHRRVRPLSPVALADDRRSLDDRDMPSRTDAIGSGVVRGRRRSRRPARADRADTAPHPLRVMFIVALVFMALGWATKSPCLQTVGAGAPDQRVANWQGQRAYYELCYSDTVPLYTAELLNRGKFPYKSSWIETGPGGQPQTQYDGKPAVRYMEYPVLTGVPVPCDGARQDVHRRGEGSVLPVVAEVVMFFNFAALGLALAWLATVWATAPWPAGESGTRRWLPDRRC